MKLTKEIIDKLKLLGFITVTTPSNAFLERFKTVEELAEAGFINDGLYKAYLTEFSESKDGELINAEDITPEVINQETTVETPEETTVETPEETSEETPQPKKTTTKKPTKKTTTKSQ